MAEPREQLLRPDTRRAQRRHRRGATGATGRRDAANRDGAVNDDDHATGAIVPGRADLSYRAGAVMPDDDAPPSPDYYETPYSIQRPDGSVDSGTLHTDQPVTHGWLSDYAQSQGGVYLGPPAPAPTPPPAPESQPPPPLPPNATDADRANRAWALGSYEPPAPAPAPQSPMPPMPAPTPVTPPRYFLSGPLDYAYAPPGVEPSPTGAPEA